jgi:hypothetical protein
VPHTFRLASRCGCCRRHFANSLWPLDCSARATFAHTLLILLATQKLAPELGAAKAASIAVGTVCAAQHFLRGLCVHRWLAGGSLPQESGAGDRLRAGGGDGARHHFPPAHGHGRSPSIFILGGVYVAIEETLEDSFCAELVNEEHHGMAFGTLATVNGAGDFLSSIIVGTLWTAFGTSVAFSYSAGLFATGAVLVLRRRASKTVQK